MSEKKLEVGPICDVDDEDTVRMSAFIDLLSTLAEADDELLEEARAFVDTDRSIREYDWDLDLEPLCEVASNIEERLIEAIQEALPSDCFMRFGTATDETDNDCWGLWPNLETARENENVIDRGEFDSQHQSWLSPDATHVLEVSDHGNVTLYRIVRTYQLEEVWGVV